MKNVITLILCCVLMVILGFTAAEARWVHRYTFNEAKNIHPIAALAFADNNNSLIFGKGNKIIKWNFKSKGASASAVGVLNGPLTDLAVPPFPNPSFFVYTTKTSLDVRRTSDLGYVGSINTPGIPTYISFTGAYGAGRFAVSGRYKVVEFKAFFEVSKRIGIIHVFDFNTNGTYSHPQEVKRLGEGSFVHDIAISADVFAVDGDSNVDMWRLNQNLSSKHFENPRNDADMTTVAISQGGRYLAAGTTDGVVYMYNISNKSLTNIAWAHTGKVNALASSPTMNICASGGDDGTVRILSFDNDNYAEVLTHMNRVVSITFSPYGGGGRYLAAGTSDGVIYIWREE